MEATSSLTSTTTGSATPLLTEPPQNFLLLDSGDAFFGESVADSSQGRVMVDAMNQLDYGAMTLGEEDLSQGLQVLASRQQEARFPILSANISVSGQNEPQLRPYVILEMQGRKVAIIGLTSLDARYAPADVVRRIKIEDPLEAAQRYVVEVRKLTNVVIVLSHLGLSTDEELARRVPGITLIVGGHTSDLLNRPIALENGKEVEVPEGQSNPADTLIVQAGKEGQNLGTLQLQIDESGRILRFLGQVTPLTKSFADDPLMVKLLQPYIDSAAVAWSDDSAYPPGKWPQFLQNASPELQQVYRLAVERKDSITVIPCYCGCGSQFGHRSLEDCYIREVRPDGSIVYDAHGLQCQICSQELSEVAKWQDQGMSLREIRARIDREFSQLGLPTDTPPI
ncbi:MAG: hypothetical protein M1305_01310 [Candidatus Marsarchaeota archaeon]|nr:hypothetical protein [Candidatus Marsarchaeota archaeon]